MTAVFIDEAIDQLRTDFRGELIQPGAPDYDEARSVYNAMIDKRPVLIARCANVADVVATVGLARDTGLDLAIRSGGHNGPGLGTVEGGIVLDLGAMNSVDVDPTARTARVGGGAT
jgi:FAD/FMN-containing dehydrogenase